MHSHFLKAPLDKKKKISVVNFYEEDKKNIYVCRKYAPSRVAGPV